jgi:mono/diheme cytochrome c family protein
MRRALSVVFASLAFLSVGCGSQIGDALLPVAQGTARGAADIALSSFADSLDAALNPPPEPEPEPALPEGDPVLGQFIFETHNCLYCHCIDARGGCAESAPNIQGASFELVDSQLRGEVTHTGGKFPEFTDFDIADIAAYLDQLAQAAASP